MKSKNKKEHEQYLNEVLTECYTPEQAVDNFIYLSNEATVREHYHQRTLGTLLRRKDPIAFQVSYKENQVKGDGKDMTNIYEINLKDYLEFPLPEFIFRTRRNLMDTNWGAHNFRSYRDMFCSFKVNAPMFTGCIFIGLNRLDLFNVFFTDHSGNIMDKITDVYVDDLIPVIARRLEG